MNRATIVFFLLGLLGVMNVDAQALERFTPKGGNPSTPATSELRTRSTIKELFSHPRGIYTCADREGCFLLPYDQAGMAIPVAIPFSRQERFGPLLVLDGAPYAVVNGFQMQSLLKPEAARWNLVPSQFAQTVTPVAYEALPDGRVAIATAKDGLFVYRPTGPQQFATVPQRISTIDHQLPHNQVNCLYTDREGILWIGTEGGMAALWQDSVYNLAQLPPPVVKSSFWRRLWGKATPSTTVFAEPITAIDQWGNSLIFTSRNGLHKTTPKLEPFTQVHRYTGAPADIFGEDVYDLLVDWDGQVWIATQQLIYYQIATEQWQVVATSGGRNGGNTPVTCLLQDEQRNYLWVGTAGRGLQWLALPE